jgi:hypothetical protein
LATVRREVDEIHGIPHERRAAAAARYAQPYSSALEADMQSKGIRGWVLAVCAATVLSACSGGPVKRVSEPQVGIQQLTVRADGSWSVDLRVDNFSSVPMTFDQVTLAVTVAGESAGTLTGNPGLDVGPESADVATLALAPSSAARIAVADALASGHSLEYHVDGTIAATPTGSGQRTFKVKRDNRLNPVPGLPGVMR